jgi:RNA polymerase sigma-70 factor (ECF subfamily)
LAAAVFSFQNTTVMHQKRPSEITKCDDPGDGPWLSRAGDGDGEAFAGLCDRYQERLFRQAMALCGGADMAEDLAQETFIAAWRGLSKFRGQCQWFTWLCGILVRLHYRSFRKQRPAVLSSLAGADREEAGLLLEWAADSGVSPASLLELGEREALLRRCLARLPEKHRQVVYLRFYVDTSLHGIAEALGCSLGTVKSRLHHALQKLAAMPELKNVHAL